MTERRCGVDFCPHEGVHPGHGPSHRVRYFCDELHRPTWLDLPGADRGVGGCFYCGKPLKARNRTKDHVIPTARGGSRLSHNVVTCCHHCNQLKGMLTGEEFLLLLPNGVKVVKEVEARFQNEYRAGCRATPPETDIYTMTRTVLAQHGITGEHGDAIASDLLRVVISKLR